MSKKPPVEVLKELPSQIGDEVLQLGLSKRRLEFTRCSKCMCKVKVSASILLRIAKMETYLVCGECRNVPGEPVEKTWGNDAIR